jgi:tripartite-type tricarboxylate transporter receptor subunit TctC
MRFVRVALLTAASISATFSAGSAQQFPSKVVQLVVPFGAGGLTDTHTRFLAAELAKVWKATVIVLNQPGAANNIAAQNVARAAPDGYTIFVGNNGPLVNNPYLFKLNYDPVRDFDAVANMYANNPALAVPANSPAKTFQDFVRLVRDNPGKYTFATGGIGSQAHISQQTLFRMLGLDMVHVPFKSQDSEVLPALVRGEVDIGIVGPSNQRLATGEIRALTVLGRQRSSVLPDVPTVAEATGLKFASNPFFGLVVPKGTPKAVIDEIAQQVVRISSDKEFVAKNVVGAGLEPMVMGPAEFESFLTAERAEASEAIPKLNIPLN